MKMYFYGMRCTENEGIISRNAKSAAKELVANMLWIMV